MNKIWDAASELSRSGKSFVTVTMLSTRGHAPQDPGAKALITKEGLSCGTIGGGKVEAKAILYAQELLQKPEFYKSPELVTWNLQQDVGMTCGGEVTYLFELHNSKAWHIVVFGAGHIAQALVRVLLPLECRVSCVDSRSEWIAKLPQAINLESCCVEDPSSSVLRFSEDSFFIVMTRGHATDIPVLESIYQNFPKAPYVGVIGSDVKALKIKNEFKNKNFNLDWIEKLRCPMGLELGTNDPAEIAISICAELIQVRDRLRKT